jgi:spermine/spermidine synthase
MPLAQTSPSPGGASLYLGVALVAMATLLFEITLTRVFAVLMWHHFAYMVVSLALLGFGAAGSLLTALRIGDRAGEVHGRLALFATGFGIAVVLAFLLATRVRVDSLELWKRPGSFLGLLLCYLILSVPFLFAGLAIGSALSSYPRQVGRLYFFDLAGSALGGFGAPWLLDRLHTDAVVAFAALIALFAGLAFALPAGNRRRLVHAVPVLPGVLLAVAFSGGGGGIPALRWPVPFAPHKAFTQLFFRDGPSERSLPSATAQVDVGSPMQMRMFMASDFGTLATQQLTLRGVTQDGTAPTALYENAADYRRFSSLADAQAATAFLAAAARGRGASEVLVIGVGGGVDVMMALYFGARRVTAVEINRAMVGMVSRDYAEFIGHLFDHPRVRLVLEDGRSYLRRTADRYDVIQLSGVDTYTALSTGAYTLSESYLYTVEAVADMYSRLKDGGYVNFSRLILTTPARRPRETLRLVNIARTALERLGVPEPWRHIAVFQGRTWASTMIRKQPFTSTEIGALRDFAEREGFFGLVFDPFRPLGRPQDNGEGHFAVNAPAEMLPAGMTAGADARAALAQAIRYALRGDTGRSDASIARSASLLGGDAATTAARLRSARDEMLPQMRQLLDYRREVLRYYERVLRGSPAEREAFVDGYFHDLRPAWDDKPFFFDYFKLARLFEAPTDVKWYEALPEFPVGHAVLISSLAQIVLLAVLLILLPLWPLARRGYAMPQKGRWFLYFAALGCGFMFVEISLMQKFTLFLGHPTYSLSVVLSSMLAVSGLGALASSRVKAFTPAVRTALLAAVTGLLVLDWIVLDPILASTIGLERPLRILIALLVIAPTAFALGFPFPLGIRLLAQRAPVLIPWGWAINGFLSVAASILAIALAMALGFSGVLLIAALVYGLGLLAVPAAREVLA